MQLRKESVGRAGMLVTSAEPGAGKSTIAANYALVAAAAGARVLVVDADLRKPVQHEVFGVRRSPGLVDLLAAREIVTRFLQRSPFGVDVVAAGLHVPNSAEALGSPFMMEFLEQAAGRYELVVVDSPPVLASADAAIIASGGLLDVVVVVDRKSGRRTVSRALRRLKQVGAPITGIAVNRDVSAESYAYSY